MRVISASPCPEGTVYTLLMEDNTQFDVVVSENDGMFIPDATPDIDEDLAMIKVLITTSAEKNAVLTDTVSEEGNRKFWVDFPSGRSLEITHENQTSITDNQYWTWSVHYSDHEYYDEYDRKASGIIETKVSNSIGSQDGIACFLWGTKLAQSL